MQSPEGYDREKKGEVCKLQRSLYGLKQAFRQWNSELSHFRIQYNFQQSSHDHCLFSYQKDQHSIALLAYVDDLLVTGISETDITKLKIALDTKFTIKDL